ncbi:MAG: helix-turn-helix domain-containing protein [Clostridiales bacterium]|nr:helix-turn-helix domain-containing protein [Clostridiales bacterium]MCD8215443.1 helix-turn-helix domain-containing protein [Clostridiales bacterium]
MGYDNRIIGANIRYERQLRNMTIDETAEMLDMDSEFFSLMERGQRVITIAELCKIADSFPFPLTLC